MYLVTYLGDLCNGLTLLIIGMVSLLESLDLVTHCADDVLITLLFLL